VPRNEVLDYQNARYLTAHEAAWRLQKFHLNANSHSVKRLAVHLEGQQQVVYAEGDEKAAVEAKRHTTLTAWFERNKTDVAARQLLYVDFPFFYMFKKNEWTRRLSKRAERTVITRMYFAQPSDQERFYLRVLLLHQRGCTSYEDVRTVDGVVYNSNFSAAQAWGLVQDDGEWVRCLEEAAVSKLADEMRRLFVQIIVFSEPADALALWERFKSDFTDDYPVRFPGITAVEAENLALHCIQDRLRRHNKQMYEAGLPEPDAAVVNHCHQVRPESQLGVIIDVDAEKALGASMQLQLNVDQKQVFDAVYNGVHRPNLDGYPRNNHLYFVDGPGGTGKTFLYNTIIHTMAGEGLPTMAVAYTGCAAMLLCRGRTCHGQFKLPVPMVSTSTSGVKKGSADAKAMRAVRVILIDEAPMMPVYMLAAISNMLRDMNGGDLRPFAGKVVLLGGDFRQVLPVANRCGRAQITALLISRHQELWPQFKCLPLTINMRAGQAEQDFARWLLQLGDGSLNVPGEDDQIRLPAECVLPAPPPPPASSSSSSTSPAADTAYASLIPHVFPAEVLADTKLAAGRAILSPHNEDALAVNEEILRRMSGALYTLHSVDSVVTDDEEEARHYPTEFLNSLTPAGLPPSELNLKLGCIVMLLRNVDVLQHLVNGTRLFIRKIGDDVLECEPVIITAGSGMSTRVFLQRMSLTPSEANVPFKLRRVQFPIRLSFAMTINKSQGQTLDCVGVLLTRPCFSHGQLYVAFSRVRSLSCVKVRIVHAESGAPLTTSNVVWKEALLRRGR
jgi:hypothetical protein